MLSTTSAVARPATPPPLVSVNHAVAKTHYWQARGGFCCKRYWWVAHRRSTPTAQRWHIAGAWWEYAQMAHARYVNEAAARARAAAASATCVGAIHAYFPSYAWGEATAIASRESGLSATAKNPTSSASGCFQLMSFWWDGSSAYGWVFNPFDARQNVMHAYLMWRADGGSFCPGQWCL